MANTTCSKVPKLGSMIIVLKHNTRKVSLLSVTSEHKTGLQGAFPVKTKPHNYHQVLSVKRLTVKKTCSLPLTAD